MRSLIHAVAIGIVGAALLHVVIILSLPAWTGRDAWTRVVNLGAPGRFFTLANEPNPTGLANDDPHIRSAVCRFDITERPLRVTSAGDVPIWSASAFDTLANETFSINDRSAIGEEVDITFVTPAQMLQLRKVMPPALARSVLVELAEPQGYVVLRAIVPGPSSERQVRDYLGEARCTAFDIG
ncbi:putative membrane protein [Hoeflea marina]|uniref:Putative membrane protein n=1 Tax=Hoeflea marina TaxID=274592 RepID=A0A317PMS6_9HYPH|nr:DUF1254 domain-containing protein [Hoeflea marina]PWW02202.1 putative membrane protein [Hoeflea marina]